MEHRKLIDHIMPNSTAPELTVLVLDEPGPGGANHAYRVEKAPGDVVANVVFQRGPINEAGLNGVSHEALLAIVIDRLRAFQNGAFACRENATALGHLEAAVSVMHLRTFRRTARAVEGTSAV